MFDLRSARYFVAVAEELHFGRAAERLQMSQPPLSQAIKQLERDVGAVLFTRTNRSVALTPAGRAFLEDCRALLRHAAAVAETPRLAAAGMHLRLTVGTVTSGLTWPLPGTLALFAERHPGAAVRLVEIDTDETAQALLDQRLDLVLSRISTAPRGISTRVLLRDHFVALLPLDHPFATGRGPIRLLELAEGPWIWLPREISPDYHDAMAAACRSNGFSPRVEHEARSIASQIALVNCGAGVTIVPRTAADHLPDRVIARPIADTPDAVILSASTRLQPGQAEDEFLRCIDEVVDVRSARV